MDSRINKYVLPVLLVLVLIIAQLLYLENHSSYLVQNISMYIISLVVLVYAVTTVNSIPKENFERTFWVFLTTYFFLSIISSIIWYFLKPDFTIQASVTEYIYSWKLIFLYTFNAFALSLLIYGLFKLIQHLGITAKKREMKIFKWINITCFIITIVCVTAYIMVFKTGMRYELYFVVLGVFASILIPIVIVLFRNIPKDKLRIPVAFVTYGMLSLLIGLAFFALRYIPIFFPHPTPDFVKTISEVSQTIQAVFMSLVSIFMLMAMISRIEISKQTENEAEVIETE